MNTVLSEGRYYGCCNVSRKAGILALSEQAYTPGLRIPEHTHKNPYFIFTLSGGQEESIGTQNQNYVPSTLAFHPAGETHSERVGSTGMRCLHLEFPLEWTGRHEGISQFLKNGSCFQGGRCGWLARRVYREFCSMDEFAPVAIEGFVLELLAEAARFRRQASVGSRPRWLVQARELIHARFTEPLSLSEIAFAVGIHPVHLSRQFREHYRWTVADYVRQLRVASACKAIATSNLSLAEIAAEAGFSDQAHFTRVCKRLTGRTPAHFRASNFRAKHRQ